MDSLATRITQLRHAARAHRAHVDLSLTPTSICSATTKVSSFGSKPTRYSAFLQLLQREGFITGWSLKSSSSVIDKKYVRVYLKYSARGDAAFRSIFLVSKPGRRVYLSTRALWQPYSTTGVYILSTPQGLLTDREARQKNVGGEVLLGIFLTTI